VNNFTSHYPANGHGYAEQNSLAESADENDHMYSVEEFKRQFKRHLKDSFDKRFVAIWLVSFAVHFSVALYFAINPPTTTIKRSEIDRIQKQFATFVLERQVAEDPPLPEPEPELLLSPESKTTISPAAKGSQDAVGFRDGGASEQPETMATSGAGSYDGSGGSIGGDQHQASREQISREVSSKGLLGLLTGSGSHARGEAVTDVLGDAAGKTRDLEQALGNLDGLKRPDKSTVAAGGGGRGKRNQKRSRTTAGGGIDNLIAGKEKLRSSNVKRVGTFEVGEISNIADESGVKSKSRDPDQVSEVINRHNSSIQYCYQRELKQNPDLKGKLVVRFTITPEGKVRDVKVVSSTLNSPRIERCVLLRIKRWDDFGRIDPSLGDATFRQVYTFGY